MATKLVKGTPVVSLADGATLGIIEHVYFDPSRMAMVGFTIRHGGGLFGGGTTGLIDMSDVHSFGPDAVMVTDVSVLRSELAVEASHGELVELETILHRTVMTEGGVTVGNVTAVHFGDQSHSLKALEVTGSGQHDRGRIVADDIQTIGDDLIIVAEPTRPGLSLSSRSKRTVHPQPANLVTYADSRQRSALRLLGA
jgi:uncharacterized protein YrrD